MITQYHRPQTLPEALALLQRDDPLSLPLAGGTAFDRLGAQPVVAVDLQSLGLVQLAKRGNSLELGAMLTLQTLLESEIPAGIAAALRHVISLEATYNLRQVATVAGTLVAASGRSPFTTALLALDAVLTIHPGPEGIGLGDLLPFRRQRLHQRLVTAVSLPLNARLAYHSVARTPADQPIVCAALAVWPSGRLRLALGGYGQAPTLAYDGTEPSPDNLASVSEASASSTGISAAISAAARSAYASSSDEWATAEYRSAMAAVLALRCLADLWSVNP